MFLKLEMHFDVVYIAPAEMLPTSVTLDSKQSKVLVRTKDTIIGQTNFSVIN